MTDEILNEIREEVGQWSKENFGEQPSVNPLRGINEEMGELVHSTLKRDQGIREGEEGVGDEAEKDAIGDMFIYLCDYSYREGIRFMDTKPKTNNNTAIESWRDTVGDYAAMVNNDSKAFYANEFLASLMSWAENLGHDFGECVELAWYDEVKGREWDSSYA